MQNLKSSMYQMEWPSWLWVLLALVLFQVHGCFGCLAKERIALLDLKASINQPDDEFSDGTNGSSLPTWDGEDGNCCEWESVECNKITKRVIQLYLNATRGEDLGDWYLNASLLLPFEELQSLNLSSNFLVGCVENEGFERLSGLNKLEILVLDGNSFDNTILSSLKELSSLKSLSLGSNLLQGHIQELDSLHNLEVLDLSRNSGVESFLTMKGLKRLKKLKVLDLRSDSFSTSILLSLGALSSLKALYLSENNLNGSTTRQELDALSNLEVLDLASTSLNKSFLQNIGVMTSLKVISLSGNGLNGTLPTQELCKLENLQELYLRDNQFVGSLPSCMQNLTSLQVLDLSNNQFGGNIASSPITGLTSLEYLSLSYNLFHGSFSFRSLANHSKLEVFESDSNELVIETEYAPWIPTFQLKLLSLSNCTFKKPSTNVILNILYYQYDLRVVDLSHNNLEGKFPTWLLENNTRIEVLNLKNNSLSGQIHLPSIPNLDTSILDISKNNISGQIPSNIGVFLPNLVLLNMSKSAFNGSIPSSLGKLRLLRILDLSYNSFLGGIPESLFRGCFSLELLKLSNCNLQGQIFPTFSNLTSLTYLYLDGNHFTGKIPDSLSTSSNLTRLDISKNNISGRLPRWMGNMSKLEALVMSKNHLEGSIPVEFCDLENLSTLDLSENNISGSIPTCFNPPQINHVLLHKNGLSGPMTNAFNGSYSLVTLDIANNYLNGKIPNWIGDLPNLSILLLKENQFEGNIPSQLCRLSTVTLLDLSHNDLSGPIPSCFYKIKFRSGFRSGKFLFEHGLPLLPTYSYQSQVKESRDLDLSQAFNYSYIESYEQAEVEFTTKTRSYPYKGNILFYMSGMDLSCNKLTGDIPPQIGNLSRIRALNFSHNHLIGPIPKTFSNLYQIESLDLSYNNLSGTIPSQLTDLNSLAVFTVAHNNLSGRMPDLKKQFLTFDESSYEGNLLLCGPPLKKNCATTGALPFDKEKKDDNDSIDVSFYVGFAAAYITVLLGFFGVLYVKPSWRHVLFRLIDVCITPSYYFLLDNLHKLATFVN